MRAAWHDARLLLEQRGEAAACVLARPPNRPGRFLYSNLGDILVGSAIERITGMPYETALGVHLLERCASRPRASAPRRTCGVTWGARCRSADSPSTSVAARQPIRAL